MINNKFYKLGVQPSAIRELFAYGLKRGCEIGKDKVFDFSLGLPNVPAPKQVKDCLEELINQDPVSLHAYSMNNGLPEVRKKIADSICNNYNFPAKAEHIFLTSGAAGALTATLNAIVNSDEEIILITPCFPEYFAWCKNIECRTVSVMADSKTFQPNIDAIKSSITSRTAAILVNSPNNPTGALYSQESLEKLACVLKEAEKKYNKQIFIIADEPYRKISFGKKVPYIPKIYNNTIVCDSASKSLSMPGERIGHIFVSSTADNVEDIYNAICGSARVLGHVCAPVLFQRLYAKCIDLPADVELYKENKQLITKKLDEIGLKYIKPEGAFYLWIKSPFDDANKFSSFAKNFEILLVPSNSFGCEGWVRLGYCVSKDTILNSFSAWDKLAKELKILNNKKRGN